MIMDNIKNSIQENGFSIVQHFYTDKHIDEIIEQLERHNVLLYDKQVVSDSNLVNSIPFINSLAHSSQLIALVKQVLGENSFPINAFILDKTQDCNWELDWHQDLKIAVKHKIETADYNNWTIESGIPHTIPPKEVLEKRLFVRIHLDDCFIDNGAILVVPKSHKNGILKNKTEIDKIVMGDNFYCEVDKGGIMFLTSLLLHKSPYSKTDRKRRILQIEYVGIKLTNGLEWCN
jgi:ectoine hydroxylase-related dioxygenase (phytanoyl-CoA dioxygenase family)